MPRLRRQRTIREDVARTLPTRATEAQVYQALNLAFEAEFLKISSQIDVFKGRIPNFENATNNVELEVMVKDFKQTAISLILYVINADSRDLAKFSATTDYTGLIKDINKFFKNDRFSIERLQGDNWQDTGQFEAFEKGARATKAVLSSLREVEKTLSNIGKTQGFFMRKTISLDDAKTQINKTIAKLTAEKRPLSRYSNALRRIAGYRTAAEEARYQQNIQSNQAMEVLRVPSSEGSAEGPPSPRRRL
jgi:hypothetical protein